MQFLVKLIATNAIIIFCAQIGRRFPTVGGLIATMPLTSLLVMIWLHTDNPGNYRLMTDYTRGVLWGIIPTILFFAAAYCCFRKGLPLALALCAGFGIWVTGACVHQWLLK